MFERLEKMDRRALVAVVLAAVLGILLFSGIAHGIRQAGWNEGFMVGLLSNGGGAAESGQAINPYLAVRGFGGHGWGWHPFWLIGGFFRFLFFGFVIMMIFKFVAFRRWAHHGYYPRGPWGHHGPHQHGPWEQQAQTPEQPAAPSQPATAASEQTPQGPEELKPTQPTSWTYL
ncbi:MAG: hypothetical protein KDE19_06290 [Caldilineaceae bacterium]|nr:hypothetical protein [Caldilineaceae bacterium]